MQGVPAAREDPGGNVTRRGDDVTGDGEENNITKRGGDVTGGGEENITGDDGEGMASRGCAGKLHHGKLHSAEYVKNYIRVTVMTSRGVNDCRARSVVAVAAAADPRRRLQTSSTAGPHCTLYLSLYTYH